MANKGSTYDIGFNDDHKTMIQKLNTNFRRLASAIGIVDNVGGQAAQSVTHHSLPDTSSKRCHPIFAIDQLQEALDEIDDKQDKDTLLKDIYPVHSVKEFTTSSVPSKYSVGMTWTKIEERTVSSSKKIYVFERTA